MYLLTIFISCLTFQESIIGTWALTSDSEFLECPDYLKFSNGNQLRILNDCHTIMDDSSIIGTANYEVSENSLLLSNLKFNSNYQSFSEDKVDSLAYRIKSDTLYLTIFTTEKRIEKYARVKE